MFTYCTQVLHLSEHAAYNRIEAARAARRYPKILEGLAAGELTLTAVRLLAPSLTVENHEAVLQSARHKTRREVEHLVAAMRPQADVPATLRKLPCAPPRGSAAPATTSPGHTGCEGEAVMVQKERLAAEPPVASSAPNARAVLAPIAPERYKIQFTVPRETYDTLRRAQELLRHVVPSGDSAVIVGRALALLVADLEKRRGADVKQPRGAGTRPDRARHAGSRPGRQTDEQSFGAIFRPPFDARCGPGTKAGARSSGPPDGAPSGASSNSITWSRMPTAAMRRSAISSCGAVGTIASRPSAGLVRTGCRHSSPRLRRNGTRRRRDGPS
jgi:hypothetical protein